MRFCFRCVNIESDALLGSLDLARCTRTLRAGVQARSSIHLIEMNAGVGRGRTTRGRNERARVRTQ
jgi:hypothetical protein